SDAHPGAQALEETHDALPDGTGFRSALRLPVPFGQAPGVYQIDVGALARDGKPYAVKNMELVELLPTEGSVRLGPLLVRSGPAPTAPLRLAAGANFENAVQLDSYDVAKGVNERRLFTEAATPSSGGAL